MSSRVVSAAPIQSTRDGASTRTREVSLDSQLEFRPATAATALAIAAQCNKMSDVLQHLHRQANTYQNQTSWEGGAAHPVPYLFEFWKGFIWLLTLSNLFELLAGNRLRKKYFCYD